MKRAGANDIATCMYYPGIDPFTQQAVYAAKGLRDPSCGGRCHLGSIRRIEMRQVALAVHL